jgi:2-polyprenyl-3-methyl-5-hydroxy-6-metoxy-1,4-benzoquinol methylase
MKFGSVIVKSNGYERQLTHEEIDAKVHRQFVGGLWDEVGVLQLNFLQTQGLKPKHYLLDVGCGALRGGCHFTSYLDADHYYGLDFNASLIEAGLMELQEKNLLSKQPHFLVNGKFEASGFGISFDFVIAQSVFTHLPMNNIIRCLIEVSKVIKTQGVFFATFFEAPSSAYLNQITHEIGGVITNFDEDPFHYSFDEFQWMAGLAGMNVELVGDWKHPRSQKMLAFSVVNK